jgi:hypothetical protein
MQHLPYCPAAQTAPGPACLKSERRLPAAPEPQRYAFEIARRNLLQGQINFAKEIKRGNLPRSPGTRLKFAQLGSLEHGLDLAHCPGPAVRHGPKLLQADSVQVAETLWAEPFKNAPGAHGKRHGGQLEFPGAATDPESAVRTGWIRQGWEPQELRACQAAFNRPDVPFQFQGNCLADVAKLAEIMQPAAMEVPEELEPVACEGVDQAA